MTGKAQLSITELRRSTRHSVRCRIIGEHRQMGEIPLEIVNISAHGFMALLNMALGRGDRVIARLPHVGRIEAHLIWTTGDRAGFQFERIIRLDDFDAMVDVLQARP